MDTSLGRSYEGHETVGDTAHPTYFDEANVDDYVDLDEETDDPVRGTREFEEACRDAGVTSSAFDAMMRAKHFAMQTGDWTLRERASEELMEDSGMTWTQLALAYCEAVSSHEQRRADILAGRLRVEKLEGLLPFLTKYAMVICTLQQAAGSVRDGVKTALSRSES